MKNTININESWSSETLTKEMLMNRTFKTGSLIVDVSQNKITLADEEITLQPKVLELLVILCVANGHTINKQDLIDELWPNTVVGPDSLANAMTKLRKVLQDDPKAPQYIKTVQRKGYVWLPQVTYQQAKMRFYSIKTISLATLGALIIAVFVYLSLPKKQPAEFPFPDLSIKKLEQGGYEIEVGIEGELTKEKELAMLEEIKRITGEETSGMVFTVDEPKIKCESKHAEKNKVCSSVVDEE